MESVANLSGKPSIFPRKLKCYFCEKDRKLKINEVFEKNYGLQNFSFVRSKKLCENCLSPFHFSSDCKRRKECNVPGCDMKSKHLTVLRGHSWHLSRNAMSRSGQRTVNKILARSRLEKMKKVILVYHVATLGLDAE